MPQVHPKKLGETFFGWGHVTGLPRSLDQQFLHVIAVDPFAFCSFGPVQHRLVPDTSVAAITPGHACKSIPKLFSRPTHCPKLKPKTCPSKGLNHIGSSLNWVLSGSFSSKGAVLFSWDPTLRSTHISYSTVYLARCPTCRVVTRSALRVM